MLARSSLARVTSGPCGFGCRLPKSRGDVPATHPGILGQARRRGPRQASLAQALAGIDVRALGEDLGRAAGQLPGTAGQSDVIDAAVVLIGHDGDDIITPDPEDWRPLAPPARATSS